MCPRISNHILKPNDTLLHEAQFPVMACYVTKNTDEICMG